MGAIHVLAQPPRLESGHVHVWIGLSPTDVLAAYVDRPEIEAGAHGKPQLVDRSSGIRFNKSDSGDLLAVAVARDREVGIDIERVDAGRRTDAIVARFFSDQEQAWVDLADPAERPRRFYETWTAKEARAKAIGRGLAGLDADDGRDFTIVELDLPDGYVGCVAIERSDTGPAQAQARLVQTVFVSR